MFKKKSTETTRVRLLKVSAQVIADICKRAVENNLPEDASVIRTSYNSNSNSFDVIVHSKKFGAVPEGTLIPEVDESPVVSDDMLR